VGFDKAAWRLLTYSGKKTIVVPQRILSRSCKCCIIVV